MIEVKDLNFSFRRTADRVIKDVSVSFQPGRTTALLGLNGSGKTTLLKLIAGLLRPASGSIDYDNKPLNQFSVTELAKERAYVAQYFGRADDYCVRDYLLFGAACRTKFYEIPGADEKEKVQDKAEHFGIGDLLKKRISEISGGERQIVSIVAAILQDTGVILLDEPTSALDMCNQSKVLSALKSLAEEKTIIFSTHNPNHALSLEGDVCLLHDGQVLDFGRASEMIAPDRLRRVYGDKICYSKDLSYEEISFSV